MERERKRSLFRIAARQGWAELFSLLVAWKLWVWFDGGMSRHDSLPDWANALPKVLQEYYLQGKLNGVPEQFLLDCEPIQDKKPTKKAWFHFKTASNDSPPQANYDSKMYETVESSRWLLGGGGTKKQWQLGSGGMGAVYYAYDTEVGRVAAVKILAEGKKDARLAEAFEREAKTVAKLTHPCLPRIDDFFVDNGRYMYAMELLDEVNGYLPLKERMGVQNQSQLLTTIAGLTDVIDYCWKKGIVHRDLKPGNMMVDNKGNVKVIDFGLSSWVFPGDDSWMWGSSYYLSPERPNSMGSASLTIESEIFTLGTILYEMITDMKLFTGNSGPEIAQKIMDVEPLSGNEESAVRVMADGLGFDPDALVEVINKAHEKDPKRRFHSGKEFFEALRDARK